MTYNEVMKLIGGYCDDNDTADIFDEIHPSFCRWNTDTRWPYYRLRGKPVTIEQAEYIISKCYEFSASGYKSGFCTQHFVPFSAYYKHGWVHPNGMIGHNEVLNKIPTCDEIIDSCYGIATAFPFVDLVAAITDIEGSPLFEMDRDDREPDAVTGEFHYVEYPMEIEQQWQGRIDFGVHIHDGRVSILGPDDTRSLYEQYRAAYEIPVIDYRYDSLNPYERDFYINNARKMNVVLKQDDHEFHKEIYLFRKIIYGYMEALAGREA